MVIIFVWMPSLLRKLGLNAQDVGKALADNSVRGLAQEELKNIEI